MPLGESLLESISYCMVQLHEGPCDAFFVVHELLPIMHTVIGFCTLQLRYFLVCIAHSKMFMVEAIYLTEQHNKDHATLLLLTASMLSRFCLIRVQ